MRPPSPTSGFFDRRVILARRVDRERAAPPRLRLGFPGQNTGEERNRRQRQNNYELSHSSSSFRKPAPCEELGAANERGMNRDGSATAKESRLAVYRIVHCAEDARQNASYFGADRMIPFCSRRNRPAADDFAGAIAQHRDQNREPDERTPLARAVLAAISGKRLVPVYR
jgi:hypothetical protein